MHLWGWGKKVRLGPITLGAILIGIIGYVDIVTDREISYTIFYVLAICYITWSVGILPGVLASFASALICFFDEYAGIEFIGNPIIPYCNACGMFAVFLIVVLLLSELKEFLRKKEVNGRGHS